MNSVDKMEIVCEGWLIKSPPDRRIWMARWRKRYFILRHSGQLPGQFILEYYTDNAKRKLKGKIDLDQCEQVDSGLTFESKKSFLLYKYMFDIRTPKRTYYLLAETELEMARWVDSICSVCGLKIHQEEDLGLSSLTPVASSSNNLVLNSSNNYVANSSNNNDTISNFTPEEEFSNSQYIFISDCLSGTPVMNNNNIDRVTRECSKESSSSIPDEPPPSPPPKNSPDRLVSGEFYDYPRSLEPITNLDSSLDSDISGHIPPIRTPTTPSAPNTPLRSSAGSVFWMGMPPKVNWNTYPSDSLSDFHQIPEDDELENINHNDINANFTKSLISENSCDIQKKSPADHKNLDFIPPPRPPKPRNLGENRKYENMVPASINNIFTDIRLPNQLSKDDSFSSAISPDFKIPPPSASSIAISDDLYDFPRPLHEDVVELTQTPPASMGSGGGSALRRPRRHAYTNAPAGFIDDETNVFRYDLKSTSAVSSQSYLSMDSGRISSQPNELYTEMSGDSHSTPSLTPTTPGAVYCNVSPGPFGSMSISDIPPAVNRSLKPRKKVSDSDIKGDPKFLTLAPPPACRIRADPQQSYRKPLRNLPSPSTTDANSHLLPFRLRNSDQSTSDDEVSSVGDSPRPVDSEVKCSFPLRRTDSEIQYLDLDLDGDAGQAADNKSPMTPDKEAASTVYKTVDFIKTKAFNETRQNVETFRKKSQN
ncbi:Protein daughter of sevenless [Nymphon striatum]|nr:Protein daughter of sevenless [Nymphon striatum]